MKHAIFTFQVFHREIASPHQSQLNTVKAAISQTTMRKHNANAETEHRTQNKEIAELSERRTFHRYETKTVLLNYTPSVRNYLSHKWIKVDVSRTKLHLDTSILMTSISGRREYTLLYWSRTKIRFHLICSAVLLLPAVEKHATCRYVAD